jgi:hypothetical protein
MNFKEYHGYKVWDNGMVCGKRGKLLRPLFGKDFYLQVNLYFNGKPHTFKIHTLVGKLFLPNFDGLPTIEHKDQNRTNNSLYNLKWETRRGQVINRGINSNNTSGVKGVTKRANNTWHAFISPSRYKLKRKSFKTKEEAIDQRLAWEEEYYNLT